eukprot:733185-Pyramimonas_sp.AAC.1
MILACVIQQVERQRAIAELSHGINDATTACKEFQKDQVSHKQRARCSADTKGSLQVAPHLALEEVTRGPRGA